MFNKPKFRIEDEVFVIIKNGEDAEVHKTKILNYDFNLTKGWFVNVEKTWEKSRGSDYYTLMRSAYLSNSDTNNTLILADRVFAGEEEAKNSASGFAEEFKKEETDNKIIRLKDEISSDKKEMTEWTKKKEESINSKEKELSKLTV